MVSLSVALIPALVAQEPHHAPGAEQLGAVVFPTSCSTAVQPKFERAVALLHSFWWDQAERAFTEVAAEDPSCAMAHWGLALARWNNPFGPGPSGRQLAAGAEAAERAVAIGAPTVRERGFIDAAAALYREHATVTNPARLRRYADVMARAHAAHPDDGEVVMFYAIALVATAPPGDTTFAQQRRAMGLLEPLFEARPDHPGLAHYMIHTNDSPRLAQLGLRAARRYAEIAPSVPHAQHMPSHIFVRLGLWDETIQANRRSYEAAEAYARERHPGAVSMDAMHALDYLVYGYLQRGEDSAAAAMAGRAAAADKVAEPGNFAIEYARASIPARMALELGRWQDAATLPTTLSTSPAPQAIIRFARGIGAARLGDAAAVRREVVALEQLEAQLLEQPNPYWGRVAGVKRRALSAWVMLADGDTAGALREAAAAADLEETIDKHPVTPGEVVPARELQADMLFEIRRYAEARRLYEATVAREPQRARSVFGAGRAAELAGDMAAARRWYTTYLDLVREGDGARPELMVARRLAGAM
jgi:tetratricopeptide (TPR) repeat protein